MSIPIFPPRRDGDLLRWSSAFNSKINATPLAFGLSNLQSVSYSVLHEAYASAYAKVVNPNTNTKAAVIAKNDAREALLADPSGGRELVRIIQAFPGTTNNDRGELGLRIADAIPTTIAPPSKAPVLSIVSTQGRVIKVRMRDSIRPHKRGKPDSAQGTVVLYHVGDTAPAQRELWAFARLASKSNFDVLIPNSVPAGSKVHLTAFWFNARKDQGPTAAATSTCISEGVGRAA